MTVTCASSRTLRNVLIYKVRNRMSLIGLLWLVCLLAFVCCEDRQGEGAEPTTEVSDASSSVASESATRSANTAQVTVEPGSQEQTTDSVDPLPPAGSLRSGRM
jgi:hypothetical protein